MGIVNARADAHAASIAVPVILPSSHPAYPAEVAVEGFLVRRHPQVALRAVVLGERRAARFALVRLGALHPLASPAHYRRYREAVHGAARERHLVVAYAAAVGAAAARRDYVALALVVHARRRVPARVVVVAVAVVVADAGCGRRGRSRRCRRRGGGRVRRGRRDRARPGRRRRRRRRRSCLRGDAYDNRGVRGVRGPVHQSLHPQPPLEIR